MDDVKNVRRPVYPRWRGEHRETGQNAFQCCGLSPLARGTPPQTAAFLRSPRFIPAGAGNTNEQQEIQPKQCGLSPLARGTRRSGMGHDAGDRFIPAGAGNTMKNRLRMVGAPVYPRWRGEHGVYDLREDHTDGLSPLARGTLLPAGLISKVERFIPAGAGNTSSRWTDFKS